MRLPSTPGACASSGKDSPNPPPHQCAAQRDAADRGDTAFNRESFRLFSNANFRPIAPNSDVGEGAPAPCAYMETRFRNRPFTRVEKRISTVQKRNYMQKYHPSKESCRSAIPYRRKSGLAGPRLPRNRNSRGPRCPLRRNIHTKVKIRVKNAI